MINKNSDTHSDIIESMNEAFDNGISYGLEYVLDELVSENPIPENPDSIDWFGDTDYFA